MYRIIQHRRWYYALSIVFLIPGIIALGSWGLRLGIDFSGGTVIEYANVSSAESLATLTEQIRSVVPEATVIAEEGNTAVARTPTLDTEQRGRIRAAVTEQLSDIQETSFETIGPTVGRELRQRAVTSTILVLIGIIAYVSWAFRRASTGPVRSWVLGMATLIALIHDIFIVLGIFALLGHFARIEVDSLFVTALLTVLGFSVHDTIVVFDRVRERILTSSADSFEETVNESVNQTLGRSLATSLTTLFVLAALWLFSGDAIRHFALALFIGIAAGTYSSIFVASPLLVTWERFRTRR